MFNKVILVGNLTRDIETRQANNGSLVAHTALATNRRFKAANGESREEVMFIDLSFFGRTAEIAREYLHRGSRILVEGRLRLDQWTDASGAKRSKHAITVESMKMLDRRGETDVERVPPYVVPQKEAKSPAMPESGPGGFDDIDIREEDIPF